MLSNTIKKLNKLRWINRVIVLSFKNKFNKKYGHKVRTGIKCNFELILFQCKIVSVHFIFLRYLLFLFWFLFWQSSVFISFWALWREYESVYASQLSYMMWKLYYETITFILFDSSKPLTLCSFYYFCCFFFYSVWEKKTEKDYSYLSKRNY